MLICQGVTYTHPNRDILFSEIDLTVDKQDKIALIGNNGVGKSTVLKLMAGELSPSGGTIKTASKPYYMPQLTGQFNTLSIAEALGLGPKIKALRAIGNGEVTETNLHLLQDDWTIEERCYEAFARWDLHHPDLTQNMSTLSGGQQARVFLAGIDIHRPEIVLLDEPGNHLDTEARSRLYEYIGNTRQTLLVVSHDRTLLNLLGKVYELGRNGLTGYGGNYEFYAKQKQLETTALEQNVKEHEKALRKAKETERESLERQQKLDARGKKKQEKAGLPTISMNTFRNNAEKSTARLKDAHAEKVTGLVKDLDELRKALPGQDKMRLDFDDADLHRGKRLIRLVDANFAYKHDPVWKNDLKLDILSGERLAIRGANGSGKTTLIKMILGELHPTKGAIETKSPNVVYIDQEYSIISTPRTVYDQAQTFNGTGLEEHEIRNRLTRFLFTKDYWDRSCSVLSGGEKMRLALCCLNIAIQAPDIIILDEPTNNLDIRNIEVLTTAVNGYQGTLLVVSHDEYFLNQIGITRSIQL